MRLFLKAPAKINLALDVLGRRADGYHRVRMVMTTIDLADRLEIEPRSQGIQVHTTSGLLPEDSRNLAYQAAALVKERFAIEQGVAISIRKHIPVAAGLAGGSSDAAAVLRGLNRLWRLGLKVPELAQLGAEIGSDVVFCVYGGTALTRGRGEVVQPIASPPPCWVVLAKPEAGLSTKAMYQLLDAAELVHPNIDAVANSMTGRDFDALCRHLGNVFEDVVLPSMPQVALIKEKMELLGADGVLMSGSGPTVFGLTRLESRMRRIVNGLRGFCPYVYGVRMGGAVPVADHGFGEVGDV